MLSIAKRELELLEKTCTDEESLELQKLITKNIMEILTLITKQGHSGFSIGYCKDILVKLLEFKPLTPLQDVEEDWEDVSNICGQPKGTTYQNKRCTAVFKRKHKDDTYKVMYLEGKVFSDDGGKTWFTNGNSHVELELPCLIPDTEYVILSDECNSDQISMDEWREINGIKEHISINENK